MRLQVQGDGTLKAVDFFAPYDANSLNTWDADFGSGGVTGLPSPYFGTAGVPHLAVAVGKDGYVYLLNRDNLGGYGERRTTAQDEVVQRDRPERRRLVASGRVARRRRLGLHPDRLRRPSRRWRVREPRHVPLRPTATAIHGFSVKGDLARRLRLLLRGAHHHLQRHRIRLSRRVDRVVPERLWRRLGTTRVRARAGNKANRSC